MNKNEKLENIHKKWIANCKCELRKVTTQAVPGDGNPNADIVFIGEAPGKNEDKIGKPFIGAAGKFLNKMLETIKLERKDIYITSIVKYRPPNNRDPNPKEKADCQEWLLEELKLISPTLVIFLGRHSMNSFFPELKIGDAHGKLFIKKFKGMTTEYFYPLYHPAAALYNGSMRDVLLKDFKKIPKILKSIEKRETKS
ncbi:MAG: uracil-DNA glycosylase [Candidatus Paceibacterota bacterium]